MRIVTRKWMLAVALVALGAVTVPALASRSTYTRRFENRTSVAVAFYRAVDGAWQYEFTAYPGIPVVQREVPKRTGGRDIWGADIGADGWAVDLQRNDFGTADWRWVVGENIPR